LRDLDVHGRIILKWTFVKWDVDSVSEADKVIQRRIANHTIIKFRNPFLGRILLNFIGAAPTLLIQFSKKPQTISAC
jgi:hypothetical protein